MSMVPGLWRPECNVALVAKAQELYHACRAAGFVFQWTHIKAHSGDAWSHFVDRGAKQYAGVPFDDVLAMPGPPAAA